MMNLLAVIAVAASLVACEKPSDPVPRTPAPTVARDVLAAAGYYSGDEAMAAWTQRREDGVRGFDGTELVGKAPAPWYLTDWVNGEATTLAALRGRVVVVRFWTSPDCPFCRKTLPALQRLADDFEGEPLTVIGAYHAKPEGSVTTMAEPAALAAEWKVRFPLALDREWQTLRAWWLASAPRNATSVTFVIGKDGRIAFVHPGPVFHPSDDPKEAKQNRGYLEVRAAITEALAK